MRDADLKVLIVEDTKTAGAVLTRVLSPFHVVGIAASGAEALRMADLHRPDVITMDINLPDTDGLSLTRRMLEKRSVPIIIVSALVKVDGQALIFEALRAGAYDVIAKNRLLDAARVPPDAGRLVRLVRVAANRNSAPPRRRPREGRIAASAPGAGRGVVAIGVSTGGPPLLRSIFADIDPSFPVPVLVAQHMAEGFMEGLVRWLAESSVLPIRIPADGDHAEPGVVYFPPSGCHLMAGGDGLLTIEPNRLAGHCPSINKLFASVAAWYGPRSICLLMTGMGRDGAEDLLTARRAGARTAVQDRATSVIFGMPGAALALGAADEEIAATEIAPWLNRLVTKSE